MQITNTEIEEACESVKEELLYLYEHPSDQVAYDTVVTCLIQLDRILHEISTDS